MLATSTANDQPISLRERLKRVQRLELFYDDLQSTPLLLQLCEISAADIPGMIELVSTDLIECDPIQFDELQSLPKPDGSEINWHDQNLLATPTNHWIPAIVAVRALIELRTELAIPLFVDLLFETWRFPRLSVDSEASHFFGRLGKVAIDPLVEAFEFSGPEEDDGRRNVVEALGVIGEEQPSLQGQITDQLVVWLKRHNKQNVGSNSEIVFVLLDFQARQLADTIRAALDAGCVDQSECGDWDKIKSALI